MIIFKKISKNIYRLIALIVPTFVSAQSITIPNPTNAGSTLMEVLTALLNRVVMPIAGVLVVMYIIYAGFTFVTAQGNPKKIEDAKQRLLWALIGSGILLGAAAISGVVENTIRGLLTF